MTIKNNASRNLCDGCLYKGPVVPYSSHHISCDKFNFIDIMMRDIDPPKVNMYAFRKGWATWPVNFDPIWIEECQYKKSVDNN